MLSLDSDLLAALPGTLPAMAQWGDRRDPARGDMARLYAVGLVSAGNGFGMKYQLYTLRVADGVQTRAPIDLDYADIDPRAEGQRSALILANGYTYIAFGGRDGDCPPYHPVVVAVSTTTGTAVHWDPQTGGQRPRRSISTMAYINNLDTPFEEDPKVTEKLKAAGMVQDPVDVEKRAGEVRQLARRFGLPE